VTRKNFRDEQFELFEIVRICCGAALFGEGLLKRAALVHGGCGDDTALIRDSFQSGEFTWGQLRHL
jgi:hypothetical protein